ncbi:MAG: T9SS type A sorting domain-containing protein [Chitinophagales bacterium]
MMDFYYGGLDTLINNTEWQWAEFIAKFDTSGNIIWRTFLSKRQRHNIWQVREMPDGSIVFIGEAVYQGVNEDAGWIGKLDANGNLLWERFHIYKERDFFRRRAIFRGDFQQTEDGGYIVAGIVWRQEDTTQSTAYNTMTWLVKLDSMGCLNGDCGIPVGVNEVPAPGKNDVEILVYPNPVNDILYIETTSQNPNKSAYNRQVQNIQIIDLNGRNVIHTKQSPINTSELSQGIYFYQVEMIGGEVVRGKFVKK